jgi:hypothetical protein
MPNDDFVAIRLLEVGEDEDADLFGSAVSHRMQPLSV